METSTEKSASAGTGKWLVAGILAALIALAALYRWRTASSFDWGAFRATFTGADWWTLAAAVPLILLAYAVRALRWAVMLRPLTPHPSFWRIFVATAIGFTAIVFFGRAGELVRPYLIAAKERVSFSSQMAAWLLERILDLMMVLLIFGIALGRISQSGISPGPKLKVVLEAGGTVIGVTAGICLAVLLLFRYFTVQMQERLIASISFLPDALHQRLEAFLAAFIEGMKSTRSNAYVVRLVGYSVLEWALVVGCFACVLRAFPATRTLSITDVIIFMGFVSFGAAVQIPGVGGGVQVASVLVLTEFFGLSLEAATGMALLLWLMTFVVIVPFGVFLAFREGLKWRSLRHISEEPGP
jgi:uncharacterized protein (TIRG00374 family)